MSNPRSQKVFWRMKSKEPTPCFEFEGFVIHAVWLPAWTQGTNPAALQSPKPRDWDRWRFVKGEVAQRAAIERAMREGSTCRTVPRSCVCPRLSKIWLKPKVYHGRYLDDGPGKTGVDHGADRRGHEIVYSD